jgi:two-component system, cell cycle sensor histidine kinase and response regulator CckA
MERPKTILLADDNREVRNLLDLVLRSQGYRVLAAENAEQALRIAEGYAGNIDLLLSDVMMPGLDGIELANRLQAARPCTAVLLVSAYAGGIVAPGRSWGFLPKPFTLRELLLQVQHSLNSPGTPSGGAAASEG